MGVNVHCNPSYKKTDTSTGFNTKQYIAMYHQNKFHFINFIKQKPPKSCLEPIILEDNVIMFLFEISSG